ncbi:hypothetical protein SVEN_3926 [Streptomyces venezuelae ATCC 10712]|uniref:Uncharacterized protein n=1 Tax=Streptomyces venezuelae (strain ATCC 10712 / CBS 650.69 / DSM 40230 / JCM 4526 / NBRC 13096 / PD 04745) TaxID=953739 RepID=F2RFR0_STRVP|nr:hypothetical protein vnz_19395 [Streptomyces venezuelae]CCA57212.1 hypothetical protein SVEN_3926 [Streptomyces venezuelae ATCC 10712]
MGGLLSIEETIQNPETAPPPDPAEAPDPVAVPPRRRVLRTVGLIAVAAVLGLVGGTAVGYRIQADREPTALPPLNQPGLAYPAKPLPKGEEPAPLSAAEDRQVKTDGDLRKLLVPRPAGARADGPDGWQSLAGYVNGFTRPEGALEFQLDQGVRRIATRAWRVGEYKRVEVNLVQYRASSGIGALEHVESQQRIAIGQSKSDSLGKSVRGSENGRYFVYPVERRAGYLDLYEARAFIQRGDIAITILMSDTRKITESEIRSLAERQLGRL